MTYRFYIIPGDFSCNYTFSTWFKEWDSNNNSLEEQMSSCQKWLDKTFPGAVNMISDATWFIEFPTLEDKTRFIITWT